MSHQSNPLATAKVASGHSERRCFTKHPTSASARLSQCASDVLMERWLLCDSEIADFDEIDRLPSFVHTLLNQDIFWLDIAMHDASLMRNRQCREYL